MITQTLQITDVPEDLIHLLDQRASQQATDRSAYIRDLLRRDLERTSASEKSMAETLAPFHEAVRESGCTEEEAIGFFDQALQEVRQERREGKTRRQS
jgi:metal-responsive CopG/Arc/MetJ family transcriptional regulator